MAPRARRDGAPAGRRGPAKDDGPQSPGAAGSPLINPVEHMSDTARSILEAARKLLRRDGFEALSVGAVATMAGEHKSTVIYHFGDKAGLITALTDAMLFDLRPEVIPSLGAHAGSEERLRFLLDFHVKAARDSEYWRTLFDLIPHFVRDRRLHARFAALMHSYYGEVLRILDLEGLPADEADVIASLMLSALEGFALQRELMGPRGFDLAARFELWREVLTPVVQRWSDQAAAARRAAADDR